MQFFNQFKFFYSLKKLILLSLFPLPWPLMADECGILEIQKNRSSNIQISNNKCISETELGLDSVLELQAGSRVWLVAKRIEPDQPNQIVCQNNSLAPVKIRVILPIYSFIKPVNLQNCIHFAPSRLTCEQNKSLETALVCAFSSKSKTQNGQKEQKLTTASVVRSSQQSQLVKPDIELCQIINNNKKNFTLKGRQTPTGELVDTTIESSEPDQKFTACVLEALKDKHFPIIAQETTVAFDY